MKRKLNNESGVVLFIVLMVTVIIMLASVSILSQSMSQNTYATSQLDQIKAEELAKGLHWAYHSTGNYSGPSTRSDSVGGKNFVSTLTSAGSSYTIQVTY